MEFRKPHPIPLNVQTIGLFLLVFFVLRFHFFYVSHLLFKIHVGGTCEAWFGGSREHGDGSSVDAKKRSPFGADLFASGCCTFQHGQFRKRYGDLTRVDARLNICSASALAKRVSNLFSSSVNGAKDPLSSPRLNLIFQQQVCLTFYGPRVLEVQIHKCMFQTMRLALASIDRIENKSKRTE